VSAGRADALTASLVFALTVVIVACERGDARAEDTGSLARSQAVEAKPTAATSPAAVTTPIGAAVPSSQPSARPKRSRKLCDGQLDKAGKPPPKKPISKHAAAGTPEPDGDVPVGAGKWTWVNFWAAWCVPCKEEIPRLLAWQTKLGAKLRVAFVSLDDDQRQLETFLEAQPASGLKATFWLHEGKEREDWLSGAGLDKDPELPLHLLIDPKGMVRCSVQGAVDDSDYDSLQAILGGH
jgi:thiol-disulfide isomerase/thioredoxin